MKTSDQWFARLGNAGEYDADVRTVRREQIGEIQADALAELNRVLDEELCGWMRKEGYSAGFADMKKRDIIESLQRTK